MICRASIGVCSVHTFTHFSLASLEFVQVQVYWYMSKCKYIGIRVDRYVEGQEVNRSCACWYP